MNKKINNQYAALMLIEILFIKGLINEDTLKNVRKLYKQQNSYISQAA